MPRPDQPLRVAYLVYRGNPHCGGQGVYTRELARELTALGHTVEVFSGQPYPDLVDSEQLTRVPSLDLYRPENPFRVPWPWEFKTRIDIAEFAIMCAAGFPEPYTFSMRVRRLLRDRRADFDVVHDNQCLGSGVAKMARRRVADARDAAPSRSPSIATSTSRTRRSAWKRFTLHRWYGFIEMQTRGRPPSPAASSPSPSRRGATSSPRWVSTRIGSMSSRSASTRPCSVPAPTCAESPVAS